MPESAAATESKPVAVEALSVPTLSAWWVLVAGVIGLVSSLTLTVEKIEILQNPAFVPSCNINPILSCGSVMVTPQASLLGFPNPLIGIAGFAVVVVTGVLAVAKVPLPRWYWIGLTAGAAVGVGFVHWLIFQSLYRIGALCPYCMVVWVVMITLLTVTAAIVLRPAVGDRTALRLLLQWRWSIVTFWMTGVFLLIMVRFWNYWSTLI